MAKMSQPSNNSILPEQEDQSESLGLHLEVQHAEKGKFELSLSEKVALKLAPWLIVLLALITTAGGTWLWLNYMPRQIPALPSTAEIQPRK